MRHAKQKTTAILLILCIVCGICLHRSAGLLEAAEEEMQTSAISPLESLVGGDGQYAAGNQYGVVYSIDNTVIAQEFVYDGKTKYCAAEGYSSIIGCEGSGGLIYSLRQTLLSNANEINKTAHRGNSVVTTLHSKGMKTANNILSAFDEECEASITLVIREGAVLVAAGNNSYSPEAFFHPDDYDDLYIDYSASADSVGSSVKPILDRMYLLHNDEYEKDDRIGSKNFVDFSYIRLDDGSVIHNHDHYVPSCYEGSTEEDPSLFWRHCTLSEALQWSSNVFHILHAERLGFTNAQTYLNEMTGIQRPIITEINKLDAVTCQKDRLPWFFFGQDFECSPVRMCHLFNHITGGIFTQPFYVAQVIQPDGTLLYEANSTARSEYRIKVKTEDDILIEAMADTFESYVSEAVSKQYDRRVLAKSGTAQNADGTQDRVMMISVLSEDRETVLASACFAINKTETDYTNRYMVEQLLMVLHAADIF